MGILIIQFSLYIFLFFADFSKVVWCQLCTESLLLCWKTYLVEIKWEGWRKGAVGRWQDCNWTTTAMGGTDWSWNCQVSSLASSHTEDHNNNCCWWSSVWLLAHKLPTTKKNLISKVCSRWLSKKKKQHTRDLTRFRSISATHGSCSPVTILSPSNCPFSPNPVTYSHQVSFPTKEFKVKLNAQLSCIVKQVLLHFYDDNDNDNYDHNNNDDIYTGGWPHG